MKKSGNKLRFWSLLVIILVVIGFAVDSKKIAKFEKVSEVKVAPNYVNKSWNFSLNIPDSFEKDTDNMDWILTLQDSDNKMARLSFMPDVAVKAMWMDPTFGFKKVILEDVVFDGSGMQPENFSELSTKTLGDNTVYFIRSGLFEGVASYRYYVVNRDKILAFYVTSSPVEWGASYKDSENNLVGKVEKLISSLKFI